MALRIFVARHGQDVDNANGLLNGHRDQPLTAVGRKQARQLGEEIATLGLGFDAIYSSPLVRALETAQILQAIIGMTADPIVLPELIERDFGVMTGKPRSQIVALCAPDIITTPTITYFLNPKGAETFPELVDRAHKVLAKVQSLQPQGSALLMCHGDVGKMIYAAATGKPWREVLTNFHFGNGELIEIAADDKVHVVELEQLNP